MAKPNDDMSGTPFLRAQVDPTTTAGVAGTPVYGGYVDNNEKRPELGLSRKYETYSDILLNTSIVAAGTRYFLNLVSQPGWRVEPANSSKQANDIALFISKALNNMRTPLHRVVRRGSLYKFYGFSVQEWTARRRQDGLIDLLDCAVRPQRTIEKWDVNKNGIVFGMVQRSSYDASEIYLPRSKVMYMVDDTISDSPEGSGLFRQIVDSATRLRRYQQLEGWGFETDLRGIPIGRAPFTMLNNALKNGDIKQEAYDAAIQPVKDFIVNHIKGPKLGLLIDSITYETQDEKESPSNQKQFDIDLLKAQSTSQPDILRSIDREILEIARILGVEQLLLGANGTGSFAMSKDKSQNFFLVVDSTLKEMVQAIVADLVKPIMLLNGWPEELTPILKTDRLQFRAISEITGALRDMALAGAVLPPNDPVILEVRDLLGMSRPYTIRDDIDASLTPQPDSAPSQEARYPAQAQTEGVPAATPVDPTAPVAAKPAPAPAPFIATPSKKKPKAGQ